MHLPIVSAILLATAAATPTLAGAEPFDRLLSTPGIARLEEGRALTYSHRRADGQAADRAFERSIRIERRANKAGVLASLGDGAAARPIAEFRGTTGNPVALLFVESVVGLLSDASDANPFYLRNRIGEAMRDQRQEDAARVTHGGRAVPATEVVLRPFEGDPHADALGPFAALELTLLLSDAVPGGVLALRATAGAAPGGYLEEMVLNDTT